ncbi:MAG: tRNA 2-thiocytidine(32) synthetase TtcA [Myxococcota bacterium]
MLVEGHRLPVRAERMHPRRLEQRIMKRVGHACRDFGLIEANDSILVALSGGKDSYAMLWALQRIQAKAPFPLRLVAYHLDQGQPGHDVTPIERHIQGTGVPYEIELQDTYTRVVEKTEPGKIYCSLCSRFRRAILYKAANRHGCNKVALGHHADDLIETVLLNMFFSGQLKSMPPRLISDDGKQQLIRPLAYVPEAELIELAEQHQYPIVPCKLCGSQEKQRQAIKGMLAEMDARYPEMRIKPSILSSLGNVTPSHLLDPALNALYRELDADGIDGLEGDPSRSGSKADAVKTGIGGLKADDAARAATELQSDGAARAPSNIQNDGDAPAALSGPAQPDPRRQSHSILRILDASVN